MKYNTFIQVGDEVDVGALEIPSVSMKYVPIQQVMSTPSIMQLLATCPLVEGYAHTLVDIKVHDLKRGQVPCIPGWHIDHRTKQVGKEREVYHLLISSDVSCTEFSLHELESDNVLHQEIATLVPDSPVLRIQPMRWYTYDNYSFHRGTQATKDGTRVLLRVCQTNRTGNTRHNFQPGYYQ